MNHVTFNVQNRFLMKLGWQVCVAEALAGLGFGLDQLPPSAMISHRPVPNQQFTRFLVYWHGVGETGEYPIPKNGTTSTLEAFMTPATQAVAT